MGTRGELERKIEVSFWVADVSSSVDECDGGFWFASDNSGVDECDEGVQFWVFRCGGDQLKVEGRNPNSDSWCFEGRDNGKADGTWVCCFF